MKTHRTCLISTFRRVLPIMADGLGVGKMGRCGDSAGLAEASVGAVFPAWGCMKR